MCIIYHPLYHTLKLKSSLSLMYMYKKKRGMLPLPYLFITTHYPTKLLCYVDTQKIYPFGFPLTYLLFIYPFYLLLCPNYWIVIVFDYNRSNRIVISTITIICCHMCHCDRVQIMKKSQCI